MLSRIAESLYWMSRYLERVDSTARLVGVWVGNNDNSPMKQVASGISGASPIWREILLAALEGKPSEGFTVPSSIVTATVDSISGFCVIFSCKRQ